MEKMVQKLTGTLKLGSARQDRGGDLTAYRYVRVGEAYLEHVRIPGELSSLLRDGETCTLWVATVKTPTPFFFKSTIYFVYALEIDGRIHQALDKTKRYWRSMKWLGVALHVFLGTFLMLMYIGLLFWVSAFRLSFVDLPLSEMEKEPA